MDDLPAVFVRRSEFDDHPAILALIGDEAQILNKRFGRFDVTYMMCARARRPTSTGQAPNGELMRNYALVHRGTPRSRCAARTQRSESRPLMGRVK